MDGDGDGDGDNDETNVSQTIPTITQTKQFVDSKIVN